MADGSQSKVLAERFYVCRGAAIRSLSKQLDVVRNQTSSDSVMAGVLTLLLNDVSFL
jgi:hypothetical protein